MSIWSISTNARNRNTKIDLAQSTSMTVKYLVRSIWWSRDSNVVCPSQFWGHYFGSCQEYFRNVLSFLLALL